MKKKSKKDFLENMDPFDLNDLFKNDINIDTDLTGKNLFLRHFSQHDIFNIFTRVGLINHLNGLGFTQLIVTIGFESHIHEMKLYNAKKTANNLLFDLRISEKRFVPDKRFFAPKHRPEIYDMIAIEWLSAQNPRASFAPERPQLPGQSKPGLGVLRYCFKIMELMAQEIHKDGFMDVPDHIHGAIMYSKRFKFFDPVHEGVLHALIRDLQEYSLSDISWGIITETVIEQYKQLPQPYNPSEQIFAVSYRLKNYYNSSRYKHIYKKYFKRKRFKFDYDEMLKRKENILRSKKIVDL